MAFVVPLSPLHASVSLPSISIPNASPSRQFNVCKRNQTDCPRKSMHFEPEAPLLVNAFDKASFAVTPTRMAVELKPAPKIQKSKLATVAPTTPEVDTGKGSGSRELESDSSLEHAGKWKVLLHNDEANTMEYVIKALRSVVPGIDHIEAVNIMLEAHTKGVGVVIVCEKEHAEFYCEGLKAYHLWSSIEPEDV
mmetsp:Transcript_12093/g.21000  ORF Transcript_12093/g.21000 Transcript_12093/m.21000 type:complete len:194 (+) Transcript_12093:61-642(+)